MEDVQAAIEALRRARDAKRVELESIEQALEKIETLGTPTEGGTARAQSSKDFEDLGITAAARRYLREQGEPRTTREIADALIARGLKTTSNNLIATMHATLRNSAAFQRTKDKRWELKSALTELSEVNT